LLLTLTHRHERGEALFKLSRAHNRAVRRLRRSYTWKTLQKGGLAGTITGYEATHGEGSGWHWHSHLLMLLKPEQAADLEGLRRELSAAWRAALEAEGLDATDSAGCHLAGGGAAHRYVAGGEWAPAWEAVGGPNKKGRKDNRSAPELLVAATEGDARAAALFREFGLSTRRLNAVVWSPELRDKLGMGKESSDEELASVEPEPAQEPPEVVALLPIPSWRAVCARRARGALLDAVGAEGWSGAASICKRLGLPPPLRPPLRPPDG
jgi:hypothetical protein